jgi:hypothetical protein
MSDSKNEAPTPRASTATKKKPEWTVGHTFTAFEALNSMASEKLEPKASAKVLKLVEWIRPFYEDIVETRKNEATRLGTPVSDGEVTIAAENIEEFNTTMRAAASEKVNVPERLKLSLDDLAGAKISPLTLLGISCIMVDM